MTKEMVKIMLDTQQVERAWGYYKHADDLQHRRHQLFVTVELALIAGFVGLPESSVDLKRMLSVFGIILVALWAALAYTVQRGMEDINKQLREADKIYDSYMDKVRPWFGLLSGKWVLNRFLPLVVLVVWMSLLYRLQ